MEKTRAEAIIDIYLALSAPSERTCIFCGEKYRGLRDICGAPSCETAWRMKMEERGYRKSFLAELPKCPVCGEEYVNLLAHCDQAGDPDHLAASVIES